MRRDDPFDFPPAARHGAQLAEVVSVRDPEGISRVQVRLVGPDADGHAPVWARVAAAFAGPDRGAFFVPDVGDEVLVIFVNGDPRFPVVVGGLWNGSQAPPETLGGDRVDRWTITGKAGTRIAIVEDAPGRERIVFETPGGASGELTDEGGGRLQVDVAGTRIRADASGVLVDAPGTVEVRASKVQVTAGVVQVDAALASFSGVVRCEVLQATTVVAATYTPGAGNIW